MAGKNKKHVAPKTATSEQCIREVERLLQKEHYKDAVKQAKMCYRAEPTPASRHLLERAYLLRARQLQQGGMLASAEEVAGHLLEFGVTDPGLLEDAIRLLLAVGKLKEARALEARVESPELKARLALEAADQAVLHPERASGAAPEILQGAALVRSALEALEAGDEAKATELLRDVARGSPFADWKLFVRGLAAFWRRETEEAVANWGRLDPARAASRIARRLRGGAGAPTSPALEAGPAATADDPGLAQLERQVFGEPVLGPLGKLRDLLAEDRWTEAVRELAPIRQALRRIDPRLAERLTRILLSPLIRATEDFDYASARTLIGNFTRVAEPLPIDARWNRLWALAWEGSQGDLGSAEEYWRKYLDDLKESPALGPEERVLAQALVWKHLAEENFAEAEMLEEPDGPFDPPAARAEIDRTWRLGVQFLEESLKLAPAHLATYQALLGAFDRWGKPKEVEAAALRLLKAFPDHLDTLRFLAKHTFNGDDPARSLEYTRRARALKPLDADLALDEWAAHVALARNHALAGRWDEGRAAFADAERALPEKRGDYHFLVRKAAFEFKAGEPGPAHALIEEAKGRLVEPTPAWLAFEIEASRYALPKSTRGEFAGALAAGLKKKVRSETAGALAALLVVYVTSETKYPGREAHLRGVVEYLGRTSRIKYRAEDLEDVCAFLGALGEDRVLLEKLVRRGLKLFPDAAYFHYANAALEFKKGPFAGDIFLARREAEKALELAQASSDPRAARSLPGIKQLLTMVSELSERPPRSPFGFGGGPLPGPSALPDSFYDILEEMCEQEGLDPDDIFDQLFGAAPGGPLPLPRPTAPKKKRK